MTDLLSQMGPGGDAGGGSSGGLSGGGGGFGVGVDVGAARADVDGADVARKAREALTKKGFKGAACDDALAATAAAVRTHTHTHASRKQTRKRTNHPLVFCVF
jgi:hypothetical protein